MFRKRASRFLQSCHMPQALSEWIRIMSSATGHQREPAPSTNATQARLSMELCRRMPLNCITGEGDSPGVISCEFQLRINCRGIVNTLKQILGTNRRPLATHAGGFCEDLASSFYRHGQVIWFLRLLRRWSGEWPGFVLSKQTLKNLGLINQFKETKERAPTPGILRQAIVLTSGDIWQSFWRFLMQWWTRLIIV